MQATLKDDAESPPGDEVTAQLKVDEYDRLLTARGIGTVVAAAELHGLNRATLFAYRSGRKSPTLSTAMRMAADLHVKVERLFELRPAGGPE